MQRQPRRIHTRAIRALISAQVAALSLMAQVISLTAQVLISTQVLRLRAALGAALISFKLSLWPLRRTMRTT